MLKLYYIVVDKDYSKRENISSLKEVKRRSKMEKITIKEVKRLLSINCSIQLYPRKKMVIINGSKKFSCSIDDVKTIQKIITEKVWFWEKI
jgi:hypothetical protein